VRIITLFNSITKKNFQTGSEGTRKLIRARIKEGHSFNDFERVIRHKFNQWQYDDKMKSFIRPQTIFGPNFDGYLNESPKSKKVAQIKPEVPQKPIEPLSAIEKDELNLRLVGMGLKEQKT